MENKTKVKRYRIVKYPLDAESMKTECIMKRLKPYRVYVVSKSLSTEYVVLLIKVGNDYVAFDEDAAIIRDVLCIKKQTACNIEELCDENEHFADFVRIPCKFHSFIYRRLIKAGYKNILCVQRYIVILYDNIGQVIGKVWLGYRAHYPWNDANEAIRENFIGYHKFKIVEE